MSKASFIPLQDRYNDLPVVLAGPIVRKVHTEDSTATFDANGNPIRKAEKAGVTIWIALRENRIIGLQVYNENETKRGSVVNVTPMKVGDNMYVALITSEQEFNHDSKYYYNILFGEVDSTSYVTWLPDFPEYDVTLFSPGILSNSTELSDRKKILCYTGESYPFFSTPRLNVDHIKVAHISCRKPHGGEFSNESDAFDHLDKKNEAEGNLPQQLFMTGDQIYADDVDASLLFLIQDAIPVLYSDSYNPESDFFGNIPSKNFDLGQREKTVIDFAGFTHEKGHAQNHLIHESEYYLMYLFAWSDVLWPSHIPDYAEVIELSNLDFDDYYDEISLRKFKLNDLNQTEKDGDLYRLKSQYHTKVRHVRQFKKNLPAARRVMANVATYMMFDDHDVTDDWFIHQKWTRNVLGDNGVVFPPPSSIGKKLGKYIVSNGLMAFALFQGFGNKPEEFSFNLNSPAFASGLVETLPYLITDWYRTVVGGLTSGTLTNLRKDINDIILPGLTSDYNVTFDNSTGHRLDSIIDWHFHLDCGLYSFIVLDTRTKRGFSSNEGASALISSESIKNQLPHREFHNSHEITFLISPAPVIGFEGVEQIQKIAMPYIGLPSADYEAWGYHPEAWDALLYGLIPSNVVPTSTPGSNPSSHNLVILSGDVHYGFSQQVRLWDFSTNPLIGAPNFSPDWKRTALPKNPINPLNHCRILNIAQLVASSAKNSAGGIQGTKFVPTLEFIGLNNEVDIVSHSQDSNWYNRSVWINTGITGGYQPTLFNDFERVIEDEPINVASNFESEKFPARQYRVLNQWDMSAKKPARIVVGFNNFGFVEPFSANGGGVKHSLIYSRNSLSDIEITEHEINFNSNINLPYNGHD